MSIRQENMWLILIVLVIASANGQRNNRFNNQFQNNNNQFVSNGRFVPQNNNNFNNNVPTNNIVNVVSNNNNNNFRATPADARDASGTEVYPGCNGTVCLPEANLCSVRKQKPGHFQFQGNSYWFSMASSENALRNARWNWFTGRNYCRKMCMDMVSFESQAEENFVEDILRRTNVDNIHLAGRLCDAEVEGCNQTRFQPLQINGWFWASTLKMMPPTNQASNNQIFNNWAPGQPNGALKADGFGLEACLALRAQGGVYNWYDEACNTRRHLVCEDLPAPNINFVRNQNPGINIP